MCRVRGACGSPMLPCPKPPQKCWMRWIDPAFIKWEAGSLRGNEPALQSEAYKFRPRPPELNPEHIPNHNHPALISNSDLPGLLIQPMRSFQVFGLIGSKLARLGAFSLQAGTALNPQTLKPPHSTTSKCIHRYPLSIIPTKKYLD